MQRLITFVLLSLCAGLFPFISDSSTVESSTQVFPGWPTKFENQRLTPLPLSENERLFAVDFPGQIQRFSDGKREYILRWLYSPTRKLHSASDCLRGVGYSIQPLALAIRSDAANWSHFQANRGIESLLVYERIYDENGNSWSDVSAWYWAALLGKSTGPWWSVVIAEQTTI